MIIIDETQSLYGKEFNDLFDTIKFCSEKNRNHINFLCFAVYSDHRANTSQDITPLAFNDNNTKSLDFLRYDEDEFYELLLYYKNHYPESNKFPINKEIQEEITRITLNHPETANVSITYLNYELKSDNENKNINGVMKLLNSAEYFSMIKNLKSCPDEKSFTKFDDDYRQFLRMLLKRKGITITHDNMYYSMAKDLERHGFLYEDVRKNEFNFVSNIMASIIFDFSLKNLPLTIPSFELEKLSIVDLAVRVFEKIPKD